VDIENCGDWATAASADSLLMRAAPAACTERVCLDIADVVRDEPTILQEKFEEMREARTIYRRASYSAAANASFTSRLASVGGGRAAEDLDDHAKIAVGREVGDLCAAERAAEHERVPPFGLRRHRVVEAGVATAMWCTPSPFSARKRA